MTSRPTFSEEKKLWSKGIRYVAGIDEVGRGAFAGPVVVASVIFSPETVNNESSSLEIINDSKLLSPKKRHEAAILIKQLCSCFSIAEISVGVINKLGIEKATQIGFRRAVATLSRRPDFLLIDAFYIQHVKKALQKPIVKGDQKSISIAAASILAKVHRDTIMENLHNRFSQYGFALHKGYGTKMHQQAIKQFGLSRLHRTSFSLEKFT